MNTVRPLLVIDSPLLLYRGFFSLPDSIKGADGRPVNGLLGATNNILFVIERENPRAVVPCFGAEDAEYRVTAFPGYHADRPPMPADLRHQFLLAPQLWEALGWGCMVHRTLEADDLLGALAAAEAERGGRTLILTGDRDLFQAASDTTQVLLLVPRGKDGPVVTGPAEVEARTGVRPDQIPDLIALRGDPSDGIPGAKGVGEKTAADLLRRHGTLEAVLAAAEGERPGVATALAAAGDQLRTFKHVATLQPVDVELPPDRETDRAGGAIAAERLGMGRLATRLTAGAPQ